MKWNASAFILESGQFKVNQQTNQKKRGKYVKTIAFHNLGCKVNGYETDVMTAKFRDAGWKIVPFSEKADVYVINTCTVTSMADRKSRQMLHRAKKTNPDGIVVAVGCYVETGLTDVTKDNAVDLCIGNNRKGSIAEILEQYLRERGVLREDTEAGNEAGKTRVTGPAAASDKTLHGAAMTELNRHPAFESMMRTAPDDSGRAYIKIQDGCNQFCSYCIIPYARGRVRSREESEILEEIRSLAASGVKEIVLTGIHIGSYGTDRGGAELLPLIRRAAKIDGIERIRLGSLEPRIMSAEFVEGIAAEPKVCPHFHLALQSGCTETLRRMNRHYTAEEFMAAVERVRKCYENPAITTDVIVGFPGETHEEFEESRRFIEAVNFYEMHVFKYSRRQGTVADRMEDQIPEEVKEARSRILQGITMRQARTFRKQFEGEEEEILSEEILTLQDLRKRTQNAYGEAGRGEAYSAAPEAAIPGEQAEWLKLAESGRIRFLTGHTTRYVTSAVPLPDGEEIPAGTLVRGRIRGPLGDLPVLLMERNG